MVFLFCDDWHDMAIMDEAQEDLHYGVQEGDADALIEDENPSNFLSKLEEEPMKKWQPLCLDGSILSGGRI